LFFIIIGTIFSDKIGIAERGRELMNTLNRFWDIRCLSNDAHAKRQTDLSLKKIRDGLLK
jgi:hypothetical protein